MAPSPEALAKVWHLLLVAGFPRRSRSASRSKSPLFKLDKEAPRRHSFVGATVLAAHAFAAALLPWHVAATAFAELAFAAAPLPPLVATVFAAFFFAAAGLRRPFFSLPKRSVVWPGPTNLLFVRLPLFTLCAAVFAHALLAPLVSRRAPPLREEGVSSSLLLSPLRDMAPDLPYGMPPSPANEATFGAFNVSVSEPKITSGLWPLSTKLRE